MGHRSATSAFACAPPEPTTTTREDVAAAIPRKDPAAPPTPIAGTAAHAVPSQCMAIGDGSPPPELKSISVPIAHSPPPGTAATSRRLSSVLGFGLGTAFQAEPFHSTVAVAVSAALLPTAHAWSRLTLASRRSLTPGSVADSVHFDPL